MLKVMSMGIYHIPYKLSVQMSENVVQRPRGSIFRFVVGDTCYRLYIPRLFGKIYTDVVVIDAFDAREANGAFLFSVYLAFESSVLNRRPLDARQFIGR